MGIYGYSFNHKHIVGVITNKFLTSTNMDIYGYSIIHSVNPSIIIMWALPAAGLSVHTPAGISRGHLKSIAQPVSTSNPNAIP